MPKIVNYKVYNEKGYVVFEGNGTETATFLKNITKEFNR